MVYIYNTVQNQKLMDGVSEHFILLTFIQLISIFISFSIYILSSLFIIHYTLFSNVCLLKQMLIEWKQKTDNLLLIYSVTLVQHFLLQALQLFILISIHLIKDLLIPFLPSSWWNISFCRISSSVVVSRCVCVMNHDWIII